MKQILLKIDDRVLAAMKKSLEVRTALDGCVRTAEDIITSSIVQKIEAGESELSLCMPGQPMQ